MLMFSSGQAPDAYFFVGVTFPVDERVGTQVPYPGSSLEKLDTYNQTDVFLTLPGNLKTSEIKWLSVWCKAYNISFGHVDFQNTVAPIEGKL